MATAAKKQAGKPATNSAKKPVAKPISVAKVAASKTPAKKPAAAASAKAAPVKRPSAAVKATPSKTKPVAVKTAPAKSKSIQAKSAPVKSAPVKSAPVKSAPVKAAPAKAAPKSRAAPPPAQAKAKPAVKKAVQSKAPETPVPATKPAVATPPFKPMKTTESKAAAGKPGKSMKKSLGAPLTDADILAMPDKDYMDNAQLAFFKAKLEAMRDEILENARETGEHLKENEVFADPNDRATVEEENLLEQRVRDRERKLLKKINASLARIEEGTYGYCLETGDPIGIPRLLARPTAELSIEAQEKHERLEKLYAD